MRIVSRPTSAVRARLRSGLATIAPAVNAKVSVVTHSPASCAVTRGALVWLLASAMAVLGAADVFAAPRHKPASAQSGKTTGADRQKTVPVHGRKAAQAQRHEHGPMPKRTAARQSEKRRAAQAAVPTVPLPRPRPVVKKSVAAALPSDFAATKQAIELVRQGKPSEATALARSIGDPVAQTLVEWALLRHAESTAGFTRYAAFISANPDWPGIVRLRRRAEARLWQERRDATTVRRFIGETPTTGVGRLALARALAAEGDRAGAEREARAAWQSAPLSADLEAVALDAFGDVLTRSDHRARMNRRIGAKDFEPAMRAAKRLGDAEVAIVKACAAAMANSAKENSAKVKKLLDAVAAEARGDLGYVLCRVNWLLQNDEVAAAARLVLAAAPEDLPRQDADEWWRKRRMLARKLIGFGEPDKAYRIVREAAPPANPYYRAEFHFMPGWIALRFLGDPASALEHFAHVDAGSADPIVRSRAAYWRGRATEAAGRFEEMRAHYEAAARHPTAYYGQLAFARLGLDQVALRSPPQVLNGVGADLVQAAHTLLALASAVCSSRSQPTSPKRAATPPSSPRSASSQRATTMPGRC